jgi:tRNA threonylcarbamoyladenosine biosynthesis protein TsaE
MRVITTKPEETAQAGASVATRLVPGDAVVVSGELGAGKTTFVRGACRALEVREPVTSPTFTIGQLYVGRDPGGAAVEIAHVDLYRLASLAGEDPALLDDYLTPDRIAFVEWPGAALDAIPRIAARVSIQHLEGDRRVIEVS